MCSKRFDSSVIQLHAEQCEGPESDNDHQWSESITRYTTTKTMATSVSKPGTGAAGGRKGGLSMGKRQAQREPGRGGRGGGREGGRGKKKSYQPSLMQLVNKEREVRGEEEIDSDTTTGQFTIYKF